MLDKNYPNIIVKSRQSLLDQPIGGKFELISIHDPDGEPVERPINCVKIINLDFHDVELSRLSTCFCSNDTNIKPFSPYQAYAVALCVYSCMEQFLNPTVVFQCEMGISRSVGMAAATARHFGMDDLVYFEKYLPNRLVYRLQLEAFRRISK